MRLESLKMAWDNKWPELIGADIGFDNKTILLRNQNYTQLKSQGSNLIDTEAYLYFQCDGCSNILDPHTKSFKTLQEKRVGAKWKVKWNLNGQGYKVYCETCEEK